MSHIAVIYYDNITGNVNCVKVSDEYNFEGYLGTLSKQELADLCKSKDLKPINFSIGRKNEIIEDCGSFSRFRKDGNCGVVLAEIRNKQNKTEGYRVLQCTPKGNIVNLTLDAIGTNNEELKLRDKNASYLQNGQIRRLSDEATKDKVLYSVACYPQKPFPEIEMKGVKKVNKTVKEKVALLKDATYTLSIKNNKLNIYHDGNIALKDATIKHTKDVGLLLAIQLGKENNKKVDKDSLALSPIFAFDIAVDLEIYNEGDKNYIFLAHNGSSGCKYEVGNIIELCLLVVDYLNNAREVDTTNTSDSVSLETTKFTLKIKEKYSKEQMQEILMCRNSGIDSIIIENPMLSVDQMHVIWTASSEGKCMDYVAKPKYAVDALQAYANLLYSPQQVELCKPIMRNSKLSADQINMLYIAQGYDVDIKDLVKQNASTDEIKAQIIRKKVRREGKSFSDMTDEEFTKINGELTEHLIETINSCKQKYAEQHRK